MITFSSILNCMLYSSIFVFILCFALKNTKIIQALSITTLFIIIILIFIRMAIPFEFPFTKAYLSLNIFPAIDTFLQMTPVFNENIFILDIILFIWITGIMYKIFKLVYGYYCLKKSILHMQNVNDEIIKRALYKVEKHSTIPPNLKIIRSQITDVPIIFGFFQPIIIIPIYEFSEDEMYYILSHELFHYSRHDLWFKLALEIICAIYWWNPIITIGLRKACTKVLEHNTDLAVVDILSEIGAVNYLDCILKASHQRKQKQQLILHLNLTTYANRNHHGELYQRFMMVLDYKRNRISNLTRAICIGLATFIFLFSFMFVVQPHYLVPPMDDDGRQIFTIDENNAYIVQYDENNYTVYINNGGKIEMTYIEDSFKKLPVYQREDVYK